MIYCKKIILYVKKNYTAFAGIPEISSEYNSAVYIEYHSDDDAALQDIIIYASELLDVCGGDENATWMAMDRHGMEKLKFFRHAVPEAVNLLIDHRRKSEPGISKLSTDMAVPAASYILNGQGRSSKWVAPYLQSMGSAS